MVKEVNLAPLVLDHAANFNFTEALPDFDMDVLSAYAESKGVRIIGHHENGTYVSNYLNQVDNAFEYYNAHKIVSIFQYMPSIIIFEVYSINSYSK